MFRLGNIRINMKIWVGFGTVLVLLAVISVVGYLALSGANRDFAEYRALARAANEAGRIQANMLTVRLAAKDFIIIADERSARRVLAEAEQARQFIGATAALVIDETGAELIPEAGQAAVLDRLSTQLEAYLTAFRQVQAYQAERTELLDGLNALGPQIAAELTAIETAAFEAEDINGAAAASAALRNLLLARLYAARFLVDISDQNAFTRAMAEFQQLDQNAAAMERALDSRQARTAAVAVVEATQTYRANLARMRDVVGERDALIRGTMDRVGPEVAELIERFKLDIKERQDELGPAATTAMQRAVVTVIIAAIVSIVTGFIAAFVIGRGISRPIIAMTGAMGRLAGGDKAVAIPAQDQTDEVGAMAKAVQVFKDNVIRNDELVAAAARDQEQRVARAERVTHLTTAFDDGVAEVLETVATASNELQHTAEGLSATAEQANRQATAVAAASEQASGNVQTVASAAEELSSSIREIGRQVDKTSGLAGTAAHEADDSNQQVERLAETAQKIGEVVQLITSIAEQTNLLALNATIEAARAGDAGKGFAVVASEVKSLANQTAKATEEIAKQIADVQSATGTTVEAIQRIGGRIREINEIATGVASAVEEQNAATQEIARNIQQAAMGTAEVSSNITGVTQAAGETGTAATQVLGASGDLARQSDRLRAIVRQFLTDVRAA